MANQRQSLPDCKELGFTVTHAVTGRLSVADLFRPSRRCGIYILHFSTGERYVGQSTDVARRYVQHRHHHPDIEMLSFKPVRRKLLDEEEDITIHELCRRGYHLRNIAKTGNPPPAPDFDDIMPLPEQERWERDLTFLNLDGPRFADEDLRRKYSRRYEEFRRLPNARSVTQILREYVLTGLPAVRRGEVSFWSASCLPAYERAVIIYSRINIFWQEVFTASSEHGRVGFSWHLALSPLEAAFGPSLKGLERRHHGIEIYSHRYQPGGEDQINILIEGYDRALALIHDPDVLRAVRVFNRRLTRKGACVYNRYHCLDLADHLVT